MFKPIAKNTKYFKHYLIQNDSLMHTISNRFLLDPYKVVLSNLDLYHVSLAKKKSSQLLKNLILCQSLPNNENEKKKT